MAALSWNRLNRKRAGNSLEEKMSLLALLQSSWYRLAKDVRGQDLIEYALMAGVVAAAAGFFLPGVTTAISTIFSQIGGVMATAASQG
jgi:pilus assembly protein Flp/PilA